MKYFYVYVLKSLKSNFLYVGYSEDYRSRIKCHNNGEVQSTKAFKPYKLIFLEIYTNKTDAKRRESYLKTTKGRTTLRTMLKYTLKNI
ncbi:hypothetical protein A2865_00445 [Candidatus Woesebacteria bacterium RIFCSPHIGHO2_01_FULL_39_17]|nr:MAG: hypothetical protein A2865_00445 [Candidatus Woesebacteria bacterium RIFCSPHIGHO2_01_FULL_39_17]OGM65254.1 MAG: hypothetical protein A3A52_01880 [Candidatus Woesebacteria bacterium RIFCSPLOWO2_01_FULL_39_14]